MTCTCQTTESDSTDTVSAIQNALLLSADYYNACCLQAVRHGVRNISNVAETAATLGFAPKHKQCQIHLQVIPTGAFHAVYNTTAIGMTATVLSPELVPHMMCCEQMRQVAMQVTFHKVVEAEVEAASRGASADEVAQLTGQPENARLVTLLKGGALSVTINKGTAKQRPGTAATSSQPDLANQVSRNWLSVRFVAALAG